MSWIESLLIITGISMDIFASMECQGALIAKVNKIQLLALSLAVAASQIVALLLGNLLVLWYYANNVPEDDQILGNILSVFIFLGIAVHLIVKAVKNERVIEHRQEKIPVGPIVRRLAINEIYAFLSGIAFGFINTDIIALLIMVAVISGIFIITGIYTGYHFGFEQKGKVYILGAILLLFAGADLFIRLITTVH